MMLSSVSRRGEAHFILKNLAEIALIREADLSADLFDRPVRVFEDLKGAVDPDLDEIIVKSDPALLLKGGRKIFRVERNGLADLFEREMGRAVMPVDILHRAANFDREVVEGNIEIMVDPLEGVALDQPADLLLQLIDVPRFIDKSIGPHFQHLRQKLLGPISAHEKDRDHAVLLPYFLKHGQPVGVSQTVIEDDQVKIFPLLENSKRLLAGFCDHQLISLLQRHL